MRNSIHALNWRQTLPIVLMVAAAPPFSHAVRADDAISVSLTIQDRKFEPAELHAPAGRAIEIHVKNLSPIPSEFESSDLHFEKIVPVGKEAVVHVRPQQPGRYNFFDDFHRETQGVLVVP